jgi:hypothetical protein
MAERDLARELRDARVRWPATPDFAGRLELTAEAQAAPARRRRARPLRLPRGRVRRALAAALVLLAGAFAIPPARAAILDVLGLGGARIERREPTATPRPVPPGARLGARLGLGQATTAAAAARAAGFRPAPPRALGAPDAVFFAASPPAGGRVSYLYRAGRAGLPRAAATGAGLLVTEMRATVTPFLEKLAGAGTRVRRLRVDGDPAFWLSGAEHGFAYSTGSGGAFEDQRLAGRTLLVERGDGLLIRIEGRVTLRRAVRTMRSIG